MSSHTIEIDLAVKCKYFLRIPHSARHHILLFSKVDHLNLKTVASKFECLLGHLVRRQIPTLNEKKHKKLPHTVEHYVWQTKVLRVYILARIEVRCTILLAFGDAFCEQRL